MALYAIGDLHLCLGAPKPMDIFGGAWVGYMDKLKEGMSVIQPEDTTVLLGDLSWSLDLPNAKKDFAWINEIPGKKIILKGNHDYWWSTAAKFQKFCQENGFENLHLLNNNCYEYEDFAICGTRLIWIFTIFNVAKYHTLGVLFTCYPLSWAICSIGQIIAFVILFKKNKKKCEQSIE